MNSIVQHIKIGFIFLIFLQTQNCEEQNHNNSLDKDMNTVVTSSETIQSPLNEVKLKRYGGMMGHEENLRINKDSMFYSFKNREIYKAKTLQRVTPNSLWDSLLHNFDDKALSNVKDGEMKVAFDGIDNVFNINGNFETQEFRNPTEHSTNLDPFFNLVDETRAQLFDEIRKR